MNKPTFAAAGISLLALSACVIAGSSAFNFSESEYVSGQTNSYDKAVKSGFDDVRSGRFEDAVEKFETALATPRHEEPNYEPLIPIAFAHCKLGNSSEARMAMRNATCALSIEEGQLKCPTAGGMEVFLGASGTMACYKMMCGDALTPYYESPTPEQTERVSILGEDLRRVKEECALD